jgi:hypothetical protein
MKDVASFLDLIDNKMMTKINQLELTRYEMVLHSPKHGFAIVGRKFNVAGKNYSKFGLSVGIPKNLHGNSLYGNGMVHVEVYEGETMIPDVVYTIMVAVFNNSTQTDEEKKVQKCSTQSDNR